MDSYDHGCPLTCAFIGSTPDEFPWGYDEEYPDCVTEKAKIATKLLELIRCGCRRYISSLEQGTEMWAAEACAAIREYGGDIELICVPTSETQANRWHPERRERYFRLLENCSEVINVGTGGADEYILQNADIILKQGILSVRAEAILKRAIEMGRQVIVV